MIKLGITCERIDPGKPQQNGRHERMHGTLQNETANPPAATLAEQQRAFDRFREEFNVERPHEALDFRDAGFALSALATLLPVCTARAILWGRLRGAPRAVEWRDQMGWRADLCQPAAHR